MMLKLTEEHHAQMNRLNAGQTRYLAREVATMAHQIHRRPWPFRSFAIRSVRKQADAGSLCAVLVLQELEEIT